MPCNSTSLVYDYGIPNQPRSEYCSKRAMKKSLFIAFALVGIGVVFTLNFGSSEAQTVPGKQPLPTPTPAAVDLHQTFIRLREIAREKGSLRVIVGLRMNFRPEGELTRTQRQRQRSQISQLQNSFIKRHGLRGKRLITRFAYIPFLTVEADERLLSLFHKDRQISSIQQDVLAAPSLAKSTPAVPE